MTDMLNNYGLYIHIPFCLRKCGYCDFVSFAGNTDLHKDYVLALIKEIYACQPVAVDTMFIGGGTPSCIDANLIFDIISSCKGHFDIRPEAEITIETNPATLTPHSLSIYKNAGINRISMGVQSMIDHELSALGRLHSAKNVIDSYAMIAGAGFGNINLDIMFGIPYQIQSSFEYTLKSVCDLNPTHISAYSLILEEGTKMYEHQNQHNLRLPGEDMERQMYGFAIDYLRSRGYKQYEISNFAKPGYESRHNLKYWHCNPYVGVGLAAHSYYGDERFYNTSNIDRYISLLRQDSLAVEEKTSLSDRDKISEYIIMGLRLNSGISLDDFVERFNTDLIDIFGDTINKHIENGFLQLEDNMLSFTKQGINVSNSILCDFV